jgi:predicted RNase H-like HicB family nuclease
LPGQCAGVIIITPNDKRRLRRRRAYGAEVVDGRDKPGHDESIRVRYARAPRSDAMKPYIGIVHKDPDSAYGISFPDAPGCFSAADEMDDVFPMAEEALSLWTEGMVEEGHTIPPTRGLSKISKDPEWQESLAESVFLIALRVLRRSAQRRSDTPQPE